MITYSIFHDTLDAFSQSGLYIIHKDILLLIR